MILFNKPKGFNLSELIVVLVIVGVLAGLALPRYNKAIETARAKEALAVLEQIRIAQRVYFIAEKFYYPGVTSAEDDIIQINADLHLGISSGTSRNWNFSIQTTGADQFEATAERTSGTHFDETIILDQDGNVSGTWTLPLP